MDNKLKQKIIGISLFMCMLFSISACTQNTSTHNCEIEGHVGGVATCQQYAVCEECGEEYGTYGEHSFSNYIVNNDATCIKDGTQTGTCDVCGAKDTVEILGSKTHNFINGFCSTCVMPQVEYILVDQYGMEYRLEEYEILQKAQGSYPNQPSEGLLRVSGLKSGEIDVESQNGYTIAMEFGGWFQEKQCITLLGNETVEIPLNNKTRIVLYGKVYKSEYFRPIL